ncbi:Cro/C1-type HTH DNA-binding domain protein [Bacteriovorax sp. BAL6_X]|uniref:helix-turn-helix domain-containing protein n=1 Tax=Bacteriovorax sp. BAL6_X TaxID=1201290 RepID=UPI000386EA73|nr:helix-turn-helix transcriptional regulator [Bacteriovorax sp. BAL6_X]EPZ49674.1 Cro/C1-type HTH DNA-binding domain protein [Bacteriovorax sp. BAL6_X]
MRNDVFVALKDVMKVRKVNYKELAARIEMSESGLKKLMAGQDCSLSKLDQICDALNINLAELFSIAQQSSEPVLKLDDKQEALFLKEPIIYHFFTELLSTDGDWKAVVKKHRLDKSESLSMLRSLDKVNLIELGENDRVKLLFKGSDINISSKLGALVSFNIDRYFFEYAQEQFKLEQKTSRGSRGSFYLKKESVTDYLKALDDLQLEFAKRSKREELLYGSEKLESITFMSYLATDFRASDYVFTK